MILDLLISAALVLGGLFALIGSYGLLRLKDPFQRLHAPTKGSTLGLGAVLLASAVIRGGSWHEVLVTAFIFLTAPLTALYLARVQLHRLRQDIKLPAPDGGGTWANADRELENRASESA